MTNTDTPAAGHNVGDARLRSIVERIERPKAIRNGQSPTARFLSKIRVAPSGCIEWTAARSPAGYGYFHWLSRNVLVHRWIYEAAYGSIREGGVIDHLCRNRACVNLSHLECVSMGENTRRGILHDVQRIKAKQQVACKRGHLLIGENLATHTKGSRSCRTCQRMKTAEWAKKNRARINELQRIRRSGGGQ